MGFIEDYTFIPPRGVIVDCRKREWITQKDLQAAFLAARLILTQPQIIALISLVVSFSKEYPILYRNKVNATDLDLKLLSSLALGSNNTINSEWLKRYLVHLRLSKRIESSSKTKVSTDSRIYASAIVNNSSDKYLKDNNNPFLIKDIIVPKSFNEWLGIKYKFGTEKSHVIPEEFKKAIDGKPYQLSKDIINKILEKSKILSVEHLQEEIDCRINSWILDISGRRDFKHVFNIKLRKWLKKVNLSEHKWLGLSEEKQKEIKKSIT